MDGATPGRVANTETTSVEVSAEVTMNTMMSARNRKISSRLSGSAAMTGKPATASLPPCAATAASTSARPTCWTHSAAPPNSRNQTAVAAAVATLPVNTTVRIFRPRDSAAMNRPANGAHENHHDQFQTVQFATHSPPV